MFGIISSLVVLLSMVTVHSNDSPISEEKYKEMAELGVSMCDDFLKMIDSGRGDCYYNYLKIECDCVGDAVRNLTGSTEMDDTKLAVEPIGKACATKTRDTKETLDYFITVLKKEYEICQITPARKMDIIQNALKHCTSTCPIRQGR